MSRHIEDKRESKRSRREKKMRERQSKDKVLDFSLKKTLA